MADKNFTQPTFGAKFSKMNCTRNTFVFGLLLVLWTSFFSCGPEAPEPKGSAPVSDNAQAAKPGPAAAPAEPQFVKEGELSFRSPDGKKIIHKVDLEISEMEGEREQGLMYRKHMDDTQGMLFVFEKLEPQAFWMHNTYIPLDIIYINDKYEIVSIQKNCKTLNDTPLPSGKPAMYVVEINGGLCDKKGIQPGMQVSWIDQGKGQERGNFLF